MAGGKGVGRFRTGGRGLCWVAVVLACLWCASCTLSTPEIEGTVIDATTKEPVAEAWVTSSAEMKSVTVAGDVTGYRTLSRPHTRTDAKGRFVVPAHTFWKGPMTLIFPRTIENVSVSASTIDDRTAGFYLKDYQGKKKMEVTIAVRPWEYRDDLREYSASARSLFDYCTTGRMGVERPSVKDGCDAWELNYAIVTNERLLSKIGTPKDMDESIYYGAALKHLAYLYKQTGDHIKALSFFQKARDFDVSYGMDLRLIQYDREIAELKEKMKKP